MTICQCRVCLLFVSNSLIKSEHWRFIHDTEANDSEEVNIYSSIPAVATHSFYFDMKFVLTSFLQLYCFWVFFTKKNVLSQMYLQVKTILKNEHLSVERSKKHILFFFHRERWMHFKGKLFQMNLIMKNYALNIEHKIVFEFSW